VTEPTDDDLFRIAAAMEHYRIDRNARDCLERLVYALFDRRGSPETSLALEAALNQRALRERKRIERALAELERSQAGRGRPKAKSAKYSGLQLQALSREWDRFESRVRGLDYETPAAKITAFVRALPDSKRALLPKKPDSIRKLVQAGGKLRQNSKAWRRSPAVAEALGSLMQIETDRREINRIVRELAALQPGTEIAERRLTTFVSETVLRHHALMSILGIDEAASFVNFQAK
jgi:hypothetical protein